MFMLLSQLPHYKLREYSSIYILKVYKAPNQSVVKNIMFFMSFQPGVSFHVVTSFSSRFLFKIPDISAQFQKPSKD